MKKIKRILALALALTLCLGLAATVFAALPSYDVIASRMSMSDSLNENDDILVAGNLKWIWYLDIEKSAKNTSELHYRRVINDDTKMTVSNLSPADCSDVLFVYVVALSKDNDGSYVSVETDANGNPVRQFAYTVSGWKTVAPSGNFSHTNITSEYYGIPAGKEVSFTCAELRALIDSSIENPMFLINVFYASPDGNNGYDICQIPTLFAYEANNKLAAELKGQKYEEPADSSNPFTDVPADAYPENAGNLYGSGRRD